MRTLYRKKLSCEEDILDLMAFHSRLMYIIAYCVFLGNTSIRDCVGLLGLRDNSSCRRGIGDYCRSLNLVVDIYFIDMKVSRVVPIVLRILETQSIPMQRLHIHCFRRPQTSSDLTVIHISNSSSTSNLGLQDSITGIFHESQVKHDC